MDVCWVGREGVEGVVVGVVCSGLVGVYAALTAENK